MPVPYDRVTTQDQDLNKVQDSIARMGQAVPDPVVDADGITRVDTSNGTNKYTVKTSDRWVVVASNGNALTVSLPSPVQKRALVVICAGTNQVTVQRLDGKPLSEGPNAVLTQAQSRTFVADGKDWN